MSLDKVANHRITRHGTIPDAFLARPCFTFCVTLSLTVIRYCYFDQKLVYNEASFSTFPRLSIVSLLLFFFFVFLFFFSCVFYFEGGLKKEVLENDFVLNCVRNSRASWWFLVHGLSIHLSHPSSDTLSPSIATYFVCVTITRGE